MNYYPYYSFPYAPISQIPKVGGLKSLFSGIKWSSILNGTQKTLNVINQAIPIIKQAGPVINNVKTMFKVMNEFKKIEVPQNNINEKNTPEINNQIIKTEGVINGPTFFQ